MIRVLQVVGKMHYGGMETLIMNLYRNIDRSQIQFDFLVHYEEPGEYDEEIRRLGGKIYVMPKTTFRNFFQYKKALNKFFEEHTEYLVIHGHLQSTAFIYHKIAKKYGVRCAVTHAHNNGVEFTLKGIASFFTSRMSQRITDEFWGCSMEACRFFFPRAVRRGKRMRILLNGIEVERFHFQEEIREKKRKELGITNQLVIGHVGRFAKQKNQRFLIDIFQEIQEKEKNSLLLLIGKGPDEEKIREKVRKSGLEDKVLFLGARDDVNEVMMAMDVFVLPSLFEGFGIVLVEAQASGLPCFCTEGKIPSTTNITNAYYPLPLEEGAGYWASEILADRDEDDERRDDKYELVGIRGFDIKKIAREVEKQYTQFHRKANGEI